jgi:hypothetical protein
VKQLGAGSRTECLKALPQAALELVGSHDRSLRHHEASPGRIYGRVTGVTVVGVRGHRLVG